MEPQGYDVVKKEIMFVFYNPYDDKLELVHESWGMIPEFWDAWVFLSQLEGDPPPPG